MTSLSAHSRVAQSIPPWLRLRISKSGPALPLKKPKKPKIPSSEEVQEVVLEPAVMVAVGGMAVAVVMGVMRVVVFTRAMLRAIVL